MEKKILLLLGYTVFVLLLLPSLVTAYFSRRQEPKTQPVMEQQQEEAPAQPQATFPNIDQAMEDYVLMVVAAEMPASFEAEALKAQAVAARTYALHEGVLYGDGQAVTDKESLQEKWGTNFEANYAKVADAVSATAGEILTYEEEPILAVFHSTSAGYTERAGNVWNQDMPYLQSVISAGDEQAPGFETKTKIPKVTVVSTLKALYPSLNLTTENLLSQIQILSRSEAGYVLQVQVGDQTLTGKQVRESLGLRSSHFTIAEEGTDLIFITRGYGHGAGMSQYGANYLASIGFSYDEILNYYYQGTTLKKP